MSESDSDVESCSECLGMCCRYVATEIGEPTCKTDYDHIRWYLLHKDVDVFIDDEGDWYIEFKSVCSMLGENNRCLGYENRPRICRKHGEEASRDCEFRGDGDPYDIRFETAEEFELYLEDQGIDWQFIL